MPLLFLRKQLPLVLISVAVIGLVSWKASHSAGSIDQLGDTLPNKPRNFDDVQKQLERAQVELERSMEKELKISNPVINMEEIHTNIELALKSIDTAKIKAQVEASLKSINTEEMKAAVAEAMKEVNAAKIQTEVDMALSKVNMEEIKVELEKIKETDFVKIEADLKKLKPEIEASINKAKIEIEKTKKEIKEFKAFEESLAKDGLIEKDKYTVEHKNGVLTINGKKQDKAVYEKYRGFLEKHKKFTISKTEDDFNIDID